MKKTTIAFAVIALCMVSSAYAKPPASDIQSKEGEKLGTAKEEKPRSGEKVKGPRAPVVIHRHVGDIGFGHLYALMLPVVAFGEGTDVHGE